MHSWICIFKFSNLLQNRLKFIVFFPPFYLSTCYASFISSFIRDTKIIFSLQYFFMLQPFWCAQSIKGQNRHMKFISNKSINRKNVQRNSMSMSILIWYQTNVGLIRKCDLSYDKLLYFCHHTKCSITKFSFASHEPYQTKPNKYIWKIIYMYTWK